MNSYGLIDLHCDTLADWKYANTGNPDTLDDPGRVLQLSNMPNDVHWAQFYAVFIPDEERGESAQHVENVVRLLDEGNTIPFIAR